MNKKGEELVKGIQLILYLIPILIILFSTTIYAQVNVSTIYAAQCNPAVNRSTCGPLITTSGHGAVELCQTCHVCGALDGVCPEDFSDGTPETDANKTFVLLRVANSDRPPAILPNGNPIIYNTGNEACATINGTCSANNVYVKSTADGIWVHNFDFGCDQSVATLLAWYVGYKCDAPKTAGCQYCPDPDCTTNLMGMTFDRITNTTIPAKVNVVSLNGVLRTEQDSDGTYSMNPFRGNVQVVCTAQDYEVTTKNVFLQREKNIVDCAMNEAACSPTCTLPDINGNPVCAARCDDQNSCNYFSDETRAICDGVREGSTVVINRTNSTHVLAVTCCTGAFEYIYRPLYNLGNNDIPNLLTRDYRKNLNGIPMTLRIITYKKE